MRVLICGDRRWKDVDAITIVLARLVREHGLVTVIEGGATGADALALFSALALDLPVETYPADWTRHGRAAGPIRNRQMLDSKPDLVIAFHDHLETSRGTKDCVTEARRRGIPVRHVTTTGEVR